MAENPLYLGQPADRCPVCDANLRDNSAAGSTLRPCPWGPHDERDYPPNGSAA